MAIKTVLRMGDPRLLETAAPVEVFDTLELHELLQDMRDTMIASKGVGLAAPQIGAGLQVVIFGMDANPRYPEAEPVPFTVLINPVLSLLDDEEGGWEGCLSIPGMRGLVLRHKRLRYEGFDPFGNRIDCIASGFHARVVQHECDHLRGVLYPMRVRDLRWFGFADVIGPQSARIAEE